MADEYFDAISNSKISIDTIREIPINLLFETNSNGMTLLLKACYNPMITNEILAELISRGSDVKHVDSVGNNLLHSLCHNPKSRIELLEYALNLGFQVDDINNLRETPLHIISKINGLYFSGLFAFLIRKGANVQDRMNYSVTALQWFCYHHSITPDILALYTALGASITDDIFLKILLQINFNELLLDCCIAFRDQAVDISHWFAYICKYKPILIHDELIISMKKIGLNINDSSLISKPIRLLCLNRDSTLDQIKCLIRHGAIYEKYDNYNPPLYDILVAERGQEFADSI